MQDDIEYSSTCVRPVCRWPRPALFVLGPMARGRGLSPRSHGVKKLSPNMMSRETSHVRVHFPVAPPLSPRRCPGRRQQVGRQSRPSIRVSETVLPTACAAGERCEGRRRAMCRPHGGGQAAGSHRSVQHSVQCSPPRPETKPRVPRGVCGTLVPGALRGITGRAVACASTASLSGPRPPAHRDTNGPGTGGTASVPRCVAARRGWLSSARNGTALPRPSVSGGGPVVRRAGVARSQVLGADRTADAW
jgi:hypothetical protein